MPFRAVPFLGSRSQGALVPMRRRYLVDGLREILVEVWPNDLVLLLALRIPILDSLTRKQLIETASHLRKYRSLMRRLSPLELEGVVAEARPDLFNIISRDGGRSWLRAQLDDLKALAEV